MVVCIVLQNYLENVIVDYLKPRVICHCHSVCVICFLLHVKCDMCYEIEAILTNSLKINTIKLSGYTV